MVLAALTLVSAMVLPAPLAPAKTAPPVIVTGGTTGSVLYGKLQRGAQLPTSNLSPMPIAAVDDRGKLSSVLWSSFAMSSVPSGSWLDRKQLSTMRSLDEALIFVDATTSDAGGFLGGGLGGIFGGKKAAAAAAAAPELDVATLEAAARLGARHVYLLLDDDDPAVLDAAVGALTASDGAPCATILAPASGCRLKTTPGWVQAPLQDHEGILTAPLALEVGWDDEEATLLPSRRRASPTDTSTIAREDFAELAFQVALRLPRAREEGAPRLRVLRVSPGDDALVERPRQNYDAVIGGPKTRARLGTDASADWVSLLSPFGPVRRSDPEDWRLLLDDFSEEGGEARAA